MEKQAAKTKNKILKLLPTAVSFQNPPFSPNRDKRSSDHHHNHHHYNHNHRFSGPIMVSMIPEEARRKSKKDQSFEEPTSPKVSCMGQIIKHKHKDNNKNKSKNKKTTTKKVTKKSVSFPKDMKPSSSGVLSSSNEVKKQASKLRRIFTGAKSVNKCDAEVNFTDGVPSLGKMRKFASGRDSLGDFDWTAEIGRADRRERCSDEEDEVIIPFSAPITVGGGGGGRGGVTLQERKEVNLWKRRTMNPPRPLQLNTMVKVN